MKVIPKKTYSAAPEAGGDHIARKNYIKENYQLNMPDLLSYPSTAFDTPEKAGMALHCMVKIIKNSDASYYIELNKLVTDIEMYTASLKSAEKEKQKQTMKVVAQAMGYFIENEKDESLIRNAYGIIEDIKNIPALKGYNLYIHEKKYLLAKEAYENPQFGSENMDLPGFSSLLPTS